MSSDPYKLPGDPSLPPGVTHRDIEENAGSDFPICAGCGVEVEEVNDNGMCVDCAPPIEDEDDED